jgi:uncharacterized protein YecE (DUF72 family)
MRNLHLGTIGWSYNFWKGKFYPVKTASKNFLTYYASQFDTVEVDSTFYRIPTPQAVTNWKNQTPSNFTFSLKFPSIITHIKMLRGCERETSVFLQRMDLLGEKLGALLLQFPPSFGADHLADLRRFLQNLPKSHRYVVEVRDECFLGEEFYSLLRANGAAFAWVDSPNMPTVEQVTSDFLYVRWEGDRSKVNGTLGKIEADVKDGLSQWANKLKPHLDRGMQIYGYFGKYYSGFPPSDISSLQNMLDKSFQETLKPVWDKARAMALTEEDVNALIEEARNQDSS